MSLMFPTIYGLALGDIAKGEHPNDSKIGASGLIMAILGGAILTPLQGYISDTNGIYSSYLLPTFCFMVVTAYAVYATRHFAKRQLTWFRREKVIDWININEYDYDCVKIMDYMLDKLKDSGIIK